MHMKAVTTVLPLSPDKHRTPHAAQKKCGQTTLWLTMLDLCCTLLHTDGLLLVARQCCIRWALFCIHAPAKHAQHTPVVGNTSTNHAQLGCRSLGHTVSGAASARLLCCTCANDWGVCMLQAVLHWCEKKTFGQQRYGIR